MPAGPSSPSARITCIGTRTAIVAIPFPFPCYAFPMVRCIVRDAGVEERGQAGPPDEVSQGAVVGMDLVLGAAGSGRGGCAAARLALALAAGCPDGVAAQRARSCREHRRQRAA